MHFKKKTVFFAALLLVLFIISCQAPSTGTSGTDTAKQEDTEKPAQEVTLDDTQVEQAKKQATTEFCKTHRIKSAELDLKSVQRRIEKEKLDLQSTEQKLAVANAAKDDAEITKKEQEKLEAEDALELARKAENEAKAKFQEVLDKCLLLDKGDNRVCKEFTDEVNNKLSSFENDLTKAKSELTDIQALLERTKTAANTTKAKIQSVEDEIDEQNLEVLRLTNLVTKFQKFKAEIEALC